MPRLQTYFWPLNRKEEQKGYKLDKEENYVPGRLETALMVIFVCHQV